MASPRIIAIDGPAGSGKSSAARLLARSLGYAYLDTGALYRAVGWKALSEGVDARDAAAVEGLCEKISIELRPSGGAFSVLVDGHDVMGEIRTPAVSQAASAAAGIPAVRKRLLSIQRQVGRGAGPGVVVEGRDIGTVVFPEAHLKFFLEASAETRVRRRHDELRERGHPEAVEKTRSEIDQRDLRDSRREIAPLRPAEDAVRIDSTHLSLVQVVEFMQETIRKKTDQRG